MELRRYAVGAAAVAASLLGAGSASATWTDPEDMSAAGQNAGEQVVGMDSNGDAVFAWTRFDGSHLRAQARTRFADGTLSPIQTLSAASEDATGVRVAVAPNGVSVISWLRSDSTNLRVQARKRLLGGALDGTLTLSGSGHNASGPDVGIDSGGNAVFCWSRNDGTNQRIQTRTLSATGVVGTTQTLSNAGLDSVDPRIGVDSDGDALVVWRRFDGGAGRIQSRPRSHTGTLGTTQNLSDSGQDADSPRVGVDPAGDAVVAWRRFDSTTYVAQERARSAAGVLSADKTLSFGGFADAFAHHLELAIAANGASYFVWDRFNGFNNDVQGRALSATGTLGQIKNLSANNIDGFDPVVAMDSNGNAMAVWRLDTGSSIAQARQALIGGTLGPTKDLSPTGENAGGLGVARTSTGATVASWLENDGHFSQVQASAGP